jgi:ribosomal protein L7/L12
MSKRTDRIVRDLSQASFRELLVVASRLHEELGGAATSILLSILSQSGGLRPTTLTLVSTGEKKIGLIKILRACFVLPLKEAKALTEELPKKLPKTDNPLVVAAELRAAGATVKVDRG